MLTFDQFLAKYNGQNKVGNTPENTGECVGLVSVWQDNLGVPHEFGNASDLLTNADKKYFDVIPNTPTGVPTKGDIVVWNKSFNGTFGHTAIATGSGDTNTFEVFEQNNPLGSNCHLRRGNYNSVDGWLHFKPQPPVNDPLAACLAQHTILVAEAVQKDAQIADLQRQLGIASNNLTMCLSNNKKLADILTQIKTIVNS